MDVKQILESMIDRIIAVELDLLKSPYPQWNTTVPFSTNQFNSQLTRIKRGSLTKKLNYLRTYAILVYAINRVDSGECILDYVVSMVVKHRERILVTSNQNYNGDNSFSHDLSDSDYYRETRDLAHHLTEEFNQYLKQLK